MKKLTILFILFSVSTGIFSQQTDPAPSLTKQDYLKKSKNQKTAAWILLGTGSLSAIVGTIKVNPDYGGSSNGSFFLVGGLVLIGVSVPLFIASGRNRRKAASLSFSNQFVPQMDNGDLVNRPVRALHLKISL